MAEPSRMINGIPIRVGSLVKIKKEAPNSWFVPVMRQYLGTVQRVESLSQVSSDAVQICMFNWNVKDLEPVLDDTPDPKNQEPITFDTNELLGVSNEQT